jgi:hypothetical protein
VSAASSAACGALRQLLYGHEAGQVVGRHRQLLSSSQDCSEPAFGLLHASCTVATAAVVIVIIVVVVFVIRMCVTLHFDSSNLKQYNMKLKHFKSLALKPEFLAKLFCHHFSLEV